MAEKKILALVDDDQFLLDMYSLKFEEGGYDVRAFSDPDAALAGFRDNLDPDVVLFDMVMPGMSGSDFLKRVKTEGLAAHATLIVLSNQNDATGVEEAQQNGVHGYILKANTVPSDVLKQVEEIIRSQIKTQ